MQCFELEMQVVLNLHLNLKVPVGLCKAYFLDNVFSCIF